MHRIGLSIVLIAFVACATDQATKSTEQAAKAASQSATQPATQVATKPKPKAAIGDWGFDLAGRDTSVAPGDDFEAYSNGSWSKKFSIPADLSRYGVFVQLRLDAEENVHGILQDLAKQTHAAGSLEQKVGDAFGAWMDVDAVNELGATPLGPHLKRIRSLRSRKAIAKEFASLHNTSPFGVGIIPNPADTTEYIAIVGQDGLGMPDRDYYLKKEDRFAQYRDAYRQYIEKMLTFAGIKGVKSKAKAIIAFETRLAKVHWTQADSRDIKKIYNPMTPAKLAKLAPQFYWSTTLKEFGLGGVDTIVVLQPSAIDRAGDIVAKTPLRTLRDYLTFHFIRNHAQVLSSDFDNAHFEFYSKTIRGIEEQRARWKRGVTFINGGMGEAVGKVYLERHFPPEAKSQMDDLVSNLVAAFKERLKMNDWMDDETRAQAVVKLATFEPRIGFPTKWTDFEPLKITSSAFDNSRAVREFQWQEQVRRLGGKVDRALWPYPPQTVNASYNPLLNQITFPAGILQPPFFDAKADPAINYGAIGGVIGHEIGHGFDDQGRRFDQEGKIRDWWSKASDVAFNFRAEMLGKQYSSYEPIEGMPINGELTMGENIGDLGGLQMAYAAYHRYLDSCCGGKAPVIDGLTGDQRFFLGWSQVWRAMMREDALRQQILTDPHSPARYRVNGVVRNLDAWYEAFDVKPENALYLPPAERVRIW